MSDMVSFVHHEHIVHDRHPEGSFFFSSAALLRIHDAAKRQSQQSCRSTQSRIEFATDATSRDQHHKMMPWNLFHWTKEGSGSESCWKSAMRVCPKESRQSSGICASDRASSPICIGPNFQTHGVVDQIVTLLPTRPKRILHASATLHLFCDMRNEHGQCDSAETKKKAPSPVGFPGDGRAIKALVRLRLSAHPAKVYWSKFPALLTKLIKDNIAALFNNAQCLSLSGGQLLPLAHCFATNCTSSLSNTMLPSLMHADLYTAARSLPKFTSLSVVAFFFSHLVCSSLCFQQHIHVSRSCFLLDGFAAPVTAPS